MQNPWTIPSGKAVWPTIVANVMRSLTNGEVWNMKKEKIALATDFDRESWIYKAAVDGICMKLLHSEMLDEYELFLDDEDPEGPSIKDQGAMLLDSIAMVSLVQ
jgi:hypothetical protein